MLVITVTQPQFTVDLGIVLWGMLVVSSSQLSGFKKPHVIQHSLILSSHLESTWLSLVLSLPHALFLPPFVAIAVMKRL
jgi:hypothetical protein